MALAANEIWLDTPGALHQMPCDWPVFILVSYVLRLNFFSKIISVLKSTCNFPDTIMIEDTQTGPFLANLTP